MHNKNMLVVAFALFHIVVFGQQDTTAIHLDAVILKTVNLQKSIFKTQDVSELVQRINTGKDLAHQLQSLTGVQIRKSGANVSKPIIDGLSSSRIVYMINGVKLENQDWADAHSPEIDADLANILSVLRGAESVKYGSNALGGVVNIETDKIPDNTSINGSATVHYSQNTRGMGSNLKLQQNLDLIKGLRWRIGANYTKHGDYHTQEYNVANSGTSLNSYQAEVEYALKNVKFKSFYSYYNSKQGNYFGALTGNIEEFEERIKHGKPLATFPYSFNLHAPYQESTHQIASTSVEWKFAPHYFLKSHYSHQKNQKEEFDIRRSALSSVPVQDMTLTANHLDIELGNKIKNRYSALGFQVRNKINYNQPGTGVTPSLPNYIYMENSLYTHHTLKLKQWMLNAGLRYDWAFMNARGINFLGQNYGENKNFSAFSAQIAAKRSTEMWDFYSSLSYGWRVPESYELYANGKQHGIPIYYVGNKNMSPEKGQKWMNSITYKTTDTSLEFQGFINRIEDYIYAVPTHQYKQLFSGPAAIFQFKQQDALLAGIDIIHATDINSNINLINKFSWIQGHEIRSKAALPNISPIRVHSTLSYQLPVLANFQDNSFRLSHEWTAKKNDFNPDYELSSNTPSSYHLFNLSASTSYPIDKDSVLKFTTSVDNLFNTLYKDYLNLHRYFVHDRGRSINVNIQLNF